MIEHKEENKMVSILINLPEKVNKMIEHYMIDNKDKIKNKNGNPDKRIAIVNILKEYKTTRRGG